MPVLIEPPKSSNHFELRSIPCILSETVKTEAMDLHYEGPSLKLEASGCFVLTVIISFIRVSSGLFMNTGDVEASSLDIAAPAGTA